MYLTDGDLLVWIADLPEPGQAVVEDAVSGRTSCVPLDALYGWRVVEPDRGS